MNETKDDITNNSNEPNERRTEYIVLAVLFFSDIMAFPAFRDVQLLQDFIISICSGLGLT